MPPFFARQSTVLAAGILSSKVQTETTIFNNIQVSSKTLFFFSVKNTKKTCWHPFPPFPRRF
jgi:hypothetical protein